MGGVSNPWPLDPSCLGTGVNPEIGGGDSDYGSVANAVVGAWSTPTTLSREILKNVRLFCNEMTEKRV